jgi:hypothetical protein
MQALQLLFHGLAVAGGVGHYLGAGHSNVNGAHAEAEARTGLSDYI